MLLTVALSEQQAKQVDRGLVLGRVQANTHFQSNVKFPVGADPGVRPNFWAQTLVGPGNSSLFINGPVEALVKLKQERPGRGGFETRPYG